MHGFHYDKVAFGECLQRFHRSLKSWKCLGELCLALIRHLLCLGGRDSTDFLLGLTDGFSGIRFLLLALNVNHHSCRLLLC